MRRSSRPSDPDPGPDSIVRHSRSTTRPARKWGVALLAVAAGVAAFFLVPKPLPELSRTEFLTEVRSGRVPKIAIIDNQVITGVSTAGGEVRPAYKSDNKGKELTA